MGEEEGYWKGKEDKSTFYAGADYGFDPNYTDEFMIAGAQPGYGPKIGEIGIDADFRLANQLKAVSDKVNTGAKVVEIARIVPSQFEDIPKQQFDELRRLKKLVGIDITLHGPLVDPSGYAGGWSPAMREQSERQMWNALERAHQIEDKGNIVVTFHSANMDRIPDFEERTFTEVTDPKTGKKKMQERIDGFIVIDETTGSARYVDSGIDYFKSDDKTVKTIEDQKKEIMKKIEDTNKESWYSTLHSISYNANHGTDLIERAIHGIQKPTPEAEENREEVEKSSLELYKKYLSGEITNVVDALKKEGIENFDSNALIQGETFLKDSYFKLQQLFNQAYNTALRNNDQKDLKKLDVFRETIAPKILDIQNDPARIKDFGEYVLQGINVLRSVKEPQTLKPMRDFAIDKSSETFSNLALKAYKNFGSSAPIISIENPPAGGPMARAKDLKDIVEESRKRLAEKLMKEENMGAGAAVKQAEKLIGVTWDVGHINMIRKMGYGDKELLKETEIVAPYVKHVHLSDNFGMEHTELPMGMGNVPTQKMMDILKQYNNKVKKIIEAVNWYEPFKVSPMRETLRAFGSPIYSMKLAPSWGSVYNAGGSYWSGLGSYLPEKSFSSYGTSFSTLPSELGGQSGGRSRLSGAPIE